MGLAQDKLGRPDQAEKAYIAATRIKDNDKTAWQGLINLYERQGANKIDAYREATLKLGQIYADAYGSNYAPLSWNVADNSLQPQ